MTSRPHAQLMELVRTRRSVRRFTTDPVTAEEVEDLVEAARWAPTAGNRQTFRVLVVTSEAHREDMAAAVEAAVERLLGAVREDRRSEARGYADHFLHFRQAPVVLAPIHRAGGGGLTLPPLEPPDAGDPRRQELAALEAERAERDTLCSVSAAITHMLLCAHSLGLGACWMTGPLLAQRQLHRVLGVPRGWELSALIPVGRPAETPSAPPRRNLVHVLRWLTEPGDSSPETDREGGRP